VTLDEARNLRLNSIRHLVREITNYCKKLYVIPADGAKLCALREQCSHLITEIRNYCKKLYFCRQMVENPVTQLGGEK
jgi:hypothetical protein